MILIADSGSTKTEWLLLNGKQQIAEAHTQGINPYFMTEEQIHHILVNELIPQLSAAKSTDIQQVFYYGAGCSSSQKCAMVVHPLSTLFSNATIMVEHDLLAAARAACGTKMGMAVILGTGSNSCLFDGKHIVKNQPSLGFILGDEGSGGHIGKELIKQFLYKELPAELQYKFEQTFHFDKDEILNTIYKKPMPNRYAASFVPFVANHIAHVHMQQLVSDCFSEFFKRHILSYSQFTQTPLSAVGSIAFIFKQQLIKTAAKFNVSIATIIQKPMEGLIAYHTQ